MAEKSVPLSREPVYRDLQKELRKRINQGHWRKGMLIPSRRALADEFQVSIPTVQKAVSDMVAEGILRVNAKRGTYVFGDPDPEVSQYAADPDGRDAAEEMRTLGTVDGPVSLVADIRPGSTSLLASGWTFVIVHEAEFALAQYGLQSRFTNSFDTYRTLFGTSGSSSAEEEAAVSRAVLETVLAEQPAAAILHESVLRGGDRALLRRVAQAGIGIVTVGSEDYGPETVSVLYDSANAAYQLAGHLLAQGCRRLLFFAPYSAPWVQTRASGVRLAAGAAGLPAAALEERIGTSSVEAVINAAPGADAHAQAAYQYAQALFAGGLTLDGVLAANDNCALGFHRAAAERGLQMGADYALAGFDDNLESQSLGLTTMHPPCAGIGREAARAVARLLRGQNDLSSVVLKSRLVVRASSARRPASD